MYIVLNQMEESISIQRVNSVMFFFQSISIGELIIRAAKHIYKAHMQGVDMMSLSAAISHFLNCFIGSFTTPHAQVNADEVSAQSTSFLIK